MTPNLDHGHEDLLETAAVWVLGALPDDEARRYREHLEGCEVCRAEVARLQPVADALPLAAPAAEPPPELKTRVMAEVEREAALLAAAGPEADRPPAGASGAEAARTGRRGWWPRLLARPAWVAAGAAAVLALGVAAGLLASDDEPTTMRAAVTSMGPDAATHGELVASDGHAELRLRDVPVPPAGRVYQVWIMRDGHAAPDAVLTVDRDGDGSVVLEGAVEGAEQVLITEEPAGGSQTPTTDPALAATPS